MPKSSSELVSLFKSLQPDSTAHHPAPSASAETKAQHWPLLNTLAPAKLNATPALTADERAHWSSQEKPGKQGYKPALSLPTVADDMALSLQRMAGRTTSVSQNLKPEAKHVTPSMTVQPTHPSTSTTSAATDSSLASKTEVQSRGNLFENSFLESQTVQPAPPEAADDSDALVRIFKRLEGQSEKPVKPDTKPSSFWARLGRR